MAGGDGGRDWTVGGKKAKDEFSNRVMFEATRKKETQTKGEIDG